jgi:hypothetical protein
LSRIIFGNKSIWYKYKQLPTIMFSRVDSGVSGEISNKMEDELCCRVSTWVFCHYASPTSATKDRTHLKSTKEDIEQVTVTNLKIKSWRTFGWNSSNVRGGPFSSTMAHVPFTQLKKIFKVCSWSFISWLLRT